ncbi:double-stranded RNA-binding protein 6 isoform X1 [Musa acuminata AAA Group]|uniref:double-stranded RNA-binding protein 6 isoform X1 n=1 Tax=Musa acuminata AAA Group TaxID=214697 RepID=UPI0031DA470B
MYKNQLQELAQRSCFNLPSYTCVREGPDHAPRFKAAVNFNGEVFESPSFCTTLRQAEHSAAEVALGALSQRGPSHSLAARILDETGVYKNLLQEIAQRVGAPLPSYTTIRSGLGHLPVFTCTVELAGITFTGEPAKNKKQAEKNAALAAWSSLKILAKEAANLSTEQENNDEQEQITIARALLNYCLKEKMAMANNPHATHFPRRFPIQLDKRPASVQPPPSVSKILPLIQQKSSPRVRATSPRINNSTHVSSYQQAENQTVRPQKFPAAGAAPYFPVRHFNGPCHGMAPPVTVRTAVPVFSVPPLPPPAAQLRQLSSAIGHTPIRMASPVRIRQSVPVFAAPPSVPRQMTPMIPAQVKEPLLVVSSSPSVFSSASIKESAPVTAPAVPVQIKESVPVATTSPSVKEMSPVIAPAIQVQVKETLPSVDVQESSVVPMACAPPKPSIQIEETVAGDVTKDLEESECTVTDSLKRLEI